MHMNIRLDKIIVKDFKRIDAIEIELKSITALVGANMSGKSSALQAAQLGVSVLQAAFSGYRTNGAPEFSGTVANDAVQFRPTEYLLDLRRGGSATQKLGYSITYCGIDLDTGDNKELQIEIRRGKNANIAINKIGDEDFAIILASSDYPFSIFTPGLSGIPIREEWRTKGAMDAAIMHGDANLYLRTVLDHLFTRGELDQAKRIAWCQDQNIDHLTDSGWKTFSVLLESCYPGARVVVNHDQKKDRYVEVKVKTVDTFVTLDMASTGMLQVIQILAYACFYAPPLILLDEPDAHLHADSQAKVYDALQLVASETKTRILFASHSPQLIQRLMYDPNASVVWLSEGAEVLVDERQLPAIPILMTLGALSAGVDVFDPTRTLILLTEDKLSDPVTVLAKANGAPDDLVVLSYNGCGNIASARLFASLIVDIRPDVQIILHRDKDFRTETEVQFELAISDSERRRQGIDRIKEIFTPFNDVEHSFAQPSHLKEVFSDISPDMIDAAFNEVVVYHRDKFVEEAKIARGQVKQTIYDSSRKRGKPEWHEVGMPDTAPNIADFIPDNGLVDVAFEHCYGKFLMNKLRTKIHGQVGGDTQDVIRRVYSATDYLIDENWQSVFEDT